MLTILLWIVAGAMVLGATLSITQVGKVRPVTTPGVAAFATLINAFFIVVIVAAAVALGNA